MVLNHRQRILALLFQRGPCKVAMLARATNLGETTVRTTLKNLVDMGEVMRTEEGLYMASASKKASPKATTTPKENGEGKTRGGPKGQREHTLERDGKVLAAVEKAKTPVTVADLAEQLGETKAFVYLSLYRLKRDGKVSISRVEGSRTPVYTKVA